MINTISKQFQNWWLIKYTRKAKEMETRSGLRACCWAREDVWTDAREGCVGFTSSAKQLVTIWQSCQ